MSIILPEARLGVTRPIGMLPTPQGRPGIEVLVIDHKVVVHIWRHAVNELGRIISEKFYTVELPASAAAQLAELLHRGSVHAARRRFADERAGEADRTAPVSLLRTPVP
jgi:hypothetical protein